MKGLVLAGTLVLALALATAASSAAAPAMRIVSLSPTATEDLFAVGAGRQVVAVDDDSDYPPDAPRTKLSGYTPNAEAIAVYRPDLVVLSNDIDGIVAELGKIGIRTLLEPAAATLPQAYAEILQLGRVTGHAGRAGRVVARMKRQIAGIVRTVPRPKPPLRVYEELDTNYYSATSKTFLGRVYTMLGLKDIADAAGSSGNGYPKLSAEYVVAASPQLVVLADGQTPAQVRGRPGWSTIAAVHDGGVVTVNPDLASRWGPRIVDLVRTIARAVERVARR